MRLGPARFRAVSLVLATAALATSGCSDDEDDAPAVGDLGVIDVQELDLPFGDAFLAPNGERIATYAEDELCVYAASGERERCVDEPLDVDPNSIRWSPDGTRLLFTENFFIYFQEPDVWLLDAESGGLTNLTDDGIDEDGFDIMSEPESGESAADIDVVPVWADDETVRFLRWHRSQDEASTVEVLELPVDGGEPEPVGTLATEVAPIDVAYTPDGGRAAYSRAEDVVLSDLGDDNAEPIADGPGYTIALSSDGEEVLVTPLASSYNIGEQPPTQVVPVDGGDPTELDAPVRWATWRTGADGLAYASFDEKDPRQLTFRLAEDADEEGREISTGSFLAPYRDASFRSPVWSTQDTILLMQESDADEETTGDDEPFQYVLLHLGSE